MITWGIHYHNLAPIYLNGMSGGFVNALTNYNNLYALLLTKVYRCSSAALLTSLVASNARGCTVLSMYEYT